MLMKRISYSVNSIPDSHYYRVLLKSQIISGVTAVAKLVLSWQISTVEMRQYLGMLSSSMIGSLYYAFYWARVTPLAVIVGLIIGELCGIGSTAASYFGEL